MRRCGNCFNGHYSTGPDEEYMYCDLGNVEEEVEENNPDCGCHRYYEGQEENKNYIYYDEFLIAPGFLIINQNVETKKVNSFIKLYKINSGNCIIGIRAYSNESIFLPNKSISKIEFSFRDIEDDKNGLFDCFNGLQNVLNDKVIYSQGQLKSSLWFEPKLESSPEVTKLFLSAKSLQKIDEIEIIVGDKKRCEDYTIFDDFYNSLFTGIHPSGISEKEVKRLLLTK